MCVEHSKYFLCLNGCIQDFEKKIFLFSENHVLTTQTSETEHLIENWTKWKLLLGNLYRKNRQRICK
jgi:hypothetical protein